MTFAAFILSTGRCGTQWIAASLAAVYPQEMHVEHEPLHDRYNARQILADSVSSADKMPSSSPEVAAHFTRIARQLATSSSIECGHPCWSAIPLAAGVIPENIRIIHLVRHPVPTAFSWLTHGAYQPPLLPHLAEKTLLSPFDQGTSFAEYQDRWEDLSPFEKCLYYWGEVNSFALCLQEKLNVPWLRLRFEDLFAREGLAILLDFLELPHREAIFEQRNITIDRFRYISGVWDDWRIIEQHPRVLALADQFGYDFEEIAEAELRCRYLASPPG